MKNFEELWDKIKRSNIYVTGDLKRRKTSRKIV